MVSYYFKIAAHSFSRDKAITAVMVMAIALGIGACMTALTVFHVLAGDPLPSKSRTLFYVLVDPKPISGYFPGVEPVPQLTRFDAEALYRSGQANVQAIMYGGPVTVHPPNTRRIPFPSSARFTSPEFFSLLG